MLWEGNSPNQSPIPVTHGLPSQRVSHAEHLCVLCCKHVQSVEQTIELPVIWDAKMPMWRHCIAFMAKASQHIRPNLCGKTNPTVTAKPTGIFEWSFRHVIVMMTFTHDDVIKWKHFPCYWQSVRGIHRSPVNSPHKGQWREALMFSLICESE